MFRYRLFDLTPVARTRLFEDLPDGVLIIDNNLNITDLNNAAAVLFKGDNQMVGRPAAEILKEWPGMLKMIGSASDRVDFELSMENGDEKKWFRIDIIPLKEKHRSVYGQMVIISDISIRKITEEKLQLLATTDELTGLWNRRYFIKCLGDELKRMKRHNHPFSLLMVDIDYFKTVNDIFGHNTGDLSLQYLSGLMRNRLREVDLVARLGGEEFGIILPDTDLDSAQAVAENLRKIIAETPFFHDGDTINLTVSIGVTECKPDTASVEELLKLADKALYSAKNEGRNRIVLI
jgi:diguanylate cyclase (GGDEF)-like protein